MIAQPNRHYDNDTLRQLLDECLPSDQANQVEGHLSGCAECQCELELIAGQQDWWDETVTVLTESTVTPKDAEIKSCEMPLQSLDASLDWIRPLLDESADGQDGLGQDGLGRIDQYGVRGVIGQGGMGVVLRGVDPELNRPVAIKVLAPHLAGVGAARVRFMREAQAAAAIVHPSIVPIYSVATSARLPYIVMPCICGGNLQQRIQREGPLEIAEVLRIGLQIAEGLAAAHQHGVIHRDIKPANILVEEGNGRVLISDFGLARALDDATLTNSGMIAGTPQYMSPEQARGEPIDARSDLFSLGSLLYALSTGRPPFRAESPLAVLRKISESRPRPIHQINEQVPAWFDALVGRLMQIDLARRIPSAEAAVALLRDAHAHVRNPAVHDLPKSLTRRPYRIGLFAAAPALLVLALSAAFSWPDPGDRSDPGESGKTGASNAAKPFTTSIPTPIVAEKDDDRDSYPWHDSAAEFELQSIQMKLAELANELETSADTEVQPPTTTFLPIKNGEPIDDAK